MRDPQMGGTMCLEFFLRNFDLMIVWGGIGSVVMGCLVVGGGLGFGLEGTGWVWRGCRWFGLCAAYAFFLSSLFAFERRELGREKSEVGVRVGIRILIFFPSRAGVRIHLGKDIMDDDCKGYI